MSNLSAACKYYLSGEFFYFKCAGKHTKGHGENNNREIIELWLLRILLGYSLIRFMESNEMDLEFVWKTV